MSIVTDEEFRALIPPLSDEEFKQLEANCAMEGIRDPLVVWKQEDGTMVLLDGHNRLKISAMHGGIPYNVVEKTFGSRDDALIWIINNQLGRRNLPTFDRVTLEDRKRSTLAAMAKQKIGGDKKSDAYKSLQRNIGNDPEDRRKNTTDYKIAKAADTSEDTVRKVRVINSSGDPHLIKSVRSGDISINEGYGIIRARTTKTPAQMRKEHIEEARETHDRVQTNPIVSITDAKADQEARKTLAVDLWRRCLNMGKQIEAIHIEASEGDVDLEMMARELTDDDYQILLHTIATIEAALTYIKKGIIR